MKKEVRKQPSIKEVLTDLSKEELMNIIMDLAQKNSTLKNSLIVRYSKDNDSQELEKCKRLIASIVREYTGREHSIPYRQTYEFVRDMEEILEKARCTVDTLMAMDIAILLVDEAMRAFHYADDSNGEIGCLAFEAMSLIEEIAIDRNDLNENVREEIFNKLLNLSDSKAFHGWDDYRINILKLCALFADIEDLREKLRLKIEDFVKKNLENANEEYICDKMLQILLGIIEKYGTKEEADKLINDNIYFTSFREMLINKYIEEKDYRKVIALALEGEEQDKGYAGLISKWKKIRYSAYKELALKEEQEILAKDLLFHGDFQYYRELKELSEGDKTVLYNSLKEELKKEKMWTLREVYLKLIIEENDLDGLMDFVRENPRDIEKYAEKLVGKFRDEVFEIYAEFIKSTASRSSNRREYHGVCEMLTRYKKLAGEMNEKALINELKVLYKNRPAFLDELSKINK